MPINRREFVGEIGSWAALGTAPLLGDDQPAQAAPPDDSSLPRRQDFAIPAGIVYLNSAYTHPLPRLAVEAARKHAEFRSEPAAVAQPEGLIDLKAEFAALIHAKPTEISYIPNTSTGENLVVNGLDIPRSGGNVVTDALHFEGALLHLQELKRRFGLDLRIVMPRDGRIELKDVERAVDRKTRLIEVSLVAMVNGFQHDLKAICNLAHAHGAYVYADIVQAVGNTPIDVRASGVDFCACSSFKWLMGDFGLGFLYVKENLLDKVIRRSQYGYYQARRWESHFLPGDSPAEVPYTWELGTEASAYFEVGTPALGVAQILAASLPYIRKLGVQRIHDHRQPLLRRLHQEMPRLGFPPITPPETTSALISFAIKDQAAVQKRLRKANINARVAERFLRVSPSVFNDVKDIEALLEALA
jgi:selenocysteine lyase/cysteine desulfurase